MVTKQKFFNLTILLAESCLRADGSLGISTNSLREIVPDGSLLWTI
jgi:hypothetical protein